MGSESACRFVEIAGAYETLTDPLRRQQYDAELRHPPEQAQRGARSWGGSQPSSRPPQPQDRARAYSLFEHVVHGAAAASGVVVMGGPGPAGGGQAGAAAASLAASVASSMTRCVLTQPGVCPCQVLC